MQNQSFKKDLILSINLNEILRSKDIVLENNFLKDGIYSEETKIHIFERIFESEKLIENNENLEEFYFIKKNSNNNKSNRINTNEKDIGKVDIKKVKKKQVKEKIFLIEKTDRKKKNMGRRKKEKKYRTKACHDKFNKDNIVRKIKIHFLNAGIKYINKKYNEFQKLTLKST